MADDNAKWFNYMILVVVCFTLIELLVLVWGLRLRGPWLATVIIAFILFLLPMPYLAWLMSGARSPGYWTALILVRPVFAWHFNWIMFVFFLALPIIIARAAAGFAGAQAPITVMRWVVLSVVTAWGLVTIYGLMATARRPKVERVEIKIPGLAGKDDGIKIAQLSDLHVAWWTSRKELEQMAEQVKALEPDLLLITGDIADHNPDYVYAFADCFEQVQPRLGRFAIIGNHDVYTDAEEIAERMEKRGYKMLRREFVNLSDRGANLALGGMDDSGLHWIAPDPEEADIPKLVARAPKGVPLIWLGHRPSSFDRIIGLPVALTLSGHTHGGQLRLPFGGPGLAKIAWSRDMGLYQQNGQTLYVTRGLGTVGWPFRIACPPEITLIVLRPAPLRKEE